MSYKLVWTSKYGKETIEEEIEDRVEADRLRREYALAFNEGNIVIVREFDV